MKQKPMLHALLNGPSANEPHALKREHGPPPKKGLEPPPLRAPRRKEHALHTQRKKGQGSPPMKGQGRNGQRAKRRDYKPHVNRPRESRRVLLIFVKRLRGQRQHENRCVLK